MATKPIIYQLLPRLFGNQKANCVPNGTLRQNGCGKFNDITTERLSQIKALGITHIWYTGIIEHATRSDYSEYGILPDNPHVVKGYAGSPYAIKDYYDVDPDLAVNVLDRMAEFEGLLQRTHKAGMKAIIDFVPNHVARRYHSDAKPEGVADLGENDDATEAFSPSNNFYYLPRQLFAADIDLGYGKDAYIEFPAKATGNDCFNAFPGEYDWYDTVKLNYGVDYRSGKTFFDPIPDTWRKMLHILLFWASKGVDGFRCDMAHMVPLRFWQWAIAEVKNRHPYVIFIAEIYDTSLYREFIHAGGFDYLYDKVNLYDTLRAIECDDLPAGRITDCWHKVEGIGERMLNFLENHDEQRFASRFYAGDASRVLPSLVVSAMINRGPMMIYAGQALGEEASEVEGFSGADGRTTIFDYWSVPSLRRWLTGGKLTELQRWLTGKYQRVLSLCNSEKALCRGEFFDLMYANRENPTIDAQKQFVFLRSFDEELLLIAVNFSDRPCHLRITVPGHAFETLGLRQGPCSATEMLSCTAAQTTLSAEEPFETSVAANNAVIWKICPSAGTVKARKRTAAKRAN